jgi:N,N-dimethylformamidase beta subunit-like, C-terminal
VWPSARAVQEENSKPGAADWAAGAKEPPSTRVEGFAGRASVTPGEPVPLYVHSLEGPVVVKAYRMGWYAGTGARLVWTSPVVSAVDQPKPQLDATTRTWSASNWTPSLTLSTDDWPPGVYVLKLQATNGTANLVPLTVRPPATRDAVVIMNGNTTWQAYNRWGGTSLYRGPTGFADRAYAVSLDRPIDYGLGTGDFWGNEAPLGRLAEKLGLPVAYVTNTDLHADPRLLDGARAVISLGHDEYYSQAMWDALVAARDQQGTNVAFLGANAMYRHIRLGPTSIGPNRLETDYKDASLDPVAKTNPAEATSQWRQPPVPRPESVVTGVYYQCNPVKANMVVAQPDSWLLAGSGLKQGDTLRTMVGSEYDQVTPSVPTPRPIEVLFHSPVTCTGHRQFSDAAYYTTPSGAGVFATGTSSWICGLVYECTIHPQDQRLVDIVTTITTTLLQVFAEGPAARTHPARDNLDRLQINATTIRDITR